VDATYTTPDATSHDFKKPARPGVPNVLLLLLEASPPMLLPLLLLLLFCEGGAGSDKRYTLEMSYNLQRIRMSHGVLTVHRLQLHGLLHNLRGAREHACRVAPLIRVTPGMQYWRPLSTTRAPATPSTHPELELPTATAGTRRPHTHCRGGLYMTSYPRSRH
jgi:hypothetical protein